MPLPTKINERIESLDFLRGIAILGILFINIESFAYPNPWSSWQYGFDNLIDHHTRFWVYFLTQGKFYTMFALLFGVGFVIFLERIQKKTKGLNALDLYARRLLWLFIFGVLHAYLIWNGDILYHYAICGFLLLPFRVIKSKYLILTVAFLAALLFIKSYENINKRKKAFSYYQEALNVPANQRTSDEIKKIKVWEKRYSKKSAETKKEVQNPKPSYWEGVKRSYEKIKVHKGEFYHQSLILSTLIVMLIGVLFYRAGIFSDYRSWNYYWLITITLLMVALFINYLRYFHWTYKDHEAVLQIWKALLFTFPKELLGISYILLFNGIYQKFLKRIRLKVFSKIGRMALSNYIFQSIVLGFIFYGYGFGLFNQFSRFELLGFVVMIWTLQISLSMLWLKYHKQGPLEFIWRKLTYKSFNN
jgi:uncharacterized protein